MTVVMAFASAALLVAVQEMHKVLIVILAIMSVNVQHLLQHARLRKLATVVMAFANAAQQVHV